MAERAVPRSLLVVEDDRLFADLVREVAAREFALEVHLAPTRAEARAVIARAHVDVCMVDEQLPDGAGHELCPELLERNEAMRIIFATAFPSFDHVVRALRLGAHDYLSKPCELEELRVVLRRALETIALQQVAAVERYRAGQAQRAAVLLGEGLSATRALVARAAATDAPVLVTGETGTGKNVVARAIHFAGRRREAPHVGINMAALPDELAEAELFGYERGAFTGAVNACRGIFEMALGGTLVLDEIGEMAPRLQAKLLTVLEDKLIKRLGTDTLRRVDVRVIATTNRDLDEARQTGAFRGDLYYRLAVVHIRVPPLRERPGDVAELARHFLELSAPGQGLAFAPGELEALAAYRWPGNVRELRNVVERAVILREGQALVPSALLEPGAVPARLPSPLPAHEPGADRGGPAPGRGRAPPHRRDARLDRGQPEPGVPPTGDRAVDAQAQGAAVRAGDLTRNALAHGAFAPSRTHQARHGRTPSGRDDWRRTLARTVHRPRWCTRSSSSTTNGPSS